MKLSLNINKEKIIYATILIFIGIIARIALHDFFNNIINPFVINGNGGFLDVFFIIALISILSGILIGRYYVFIVPICIIAITDIFYGIINPINVTYWYSWLFLFTTSGYVFIALLGSYTKKKININMSFIPKILGVGIFGVLIYDLWTNFGFWLGFSKLGFYPQTIEGLFTVFISGIPFMIWHILSFSIVLAIFTIPLVLYKEKIIFLSLPFEKRKDSIYIISVTLFLIAVSIISAII
jgi:hypothetical protein